MKGPAAAEHRINNKGPMLLKPLESPAPPNYPLRDPKYHLIEIRRPLIEVHWGV